MDKDTRNAIERATQRIRHLLQEDFAEQLDAMFDVRLDGRIANEGGRHLTGRQLLLRDRIVAAIEHKRRAGMKPADAVRDYLRDAAFTTLNRFAALKMLEPRGLVQECISRGENSIGFTEFCGLAPALKTADGAGYRFYIESIFDELSTEVKVLFDRRDPASVLWPKKAIFDDILEILNGDDLKEVWKEDETIGWIYQFFNSGEERRLMREQSAAPQDSRELAVRNQFFTPHYVVRFLGNNTLGRIWSNMRAGETRLSDLCKSLVDIPESRKRQKRDPRSITALDPACGSGHFLLYLFGLFIVIYEEAWADPTSPAFELTGHSLREDYPTLEEFRAALPSLILRYNLHGVDIDPRCAQIAKLALWMRAQRFFEQQKIARSERLMIRRMNIVIAEPIPAEPKVVQEFAESLKPALVGELFKEIASELHLAGELGVLLRVDTRLSTTIARARKSFLENASYLPGFAPDDNLGSGLSEVNDAEFFESIEGKLFASLREFVGAAVNGEGLRRRLFAEDAEQGIAFVEIVMRKFDVLLMNPPFGDATPRASDYLEKNYYDTRLDLFAAFCKRLIEMVTPDGLIGAITPRDGFFKKTLVGWRELVIANQMPLVADLGIGVLDGATVRVAAYILASGRTKDPSVFVDLVDLQDRESKLEDAENNRDRRSSVRLSAFATLPLSRFLYWLPTRLWELYQNSPPLENLACTPRYGLATFDDERFCRLAFEVRSTSIGNDNVWAFLSKGGDEYPFGGVSSAVVKWKDDAAEMAEVNRRSNGQIAQTRRASRFYFQPALSFPNRSVQFSTRWHPANYAFSMRGPAIIPISASQAYLMGFFNSRLVRCLIQMQTASQTYTTGVLKELRWVEPDADTAKAVELAATEAFSLVRTRLATVETDPFFTGVFEGETIPPTFGEFCSSRRSSVVDTNARLLELQREIDARIGDLYGVSIEDLEKCERVDQEEGGTKVAFPPPFEYSFNEAETLVSYLLGVALGRWGTSLPARLPNLSEAAPPRPPAALSDNSERQIVVDDDGHPDDIVSLIENATRRIFGINSEAITEIEASLGADLRNWLRHSFFAKHRTAYSGASRSAPLYWQLGPPSASYSVWTNYHAMTKDTLFRIQDEYLSPKLALEQRKLDAMRQDAQSGGTSKLRRAIEEQEELVADLKQFLDEVKRVAPLWTPAADDGVLLNAAPFWRLVAPNRVWQRDVKNCWEKLSSGEYDWSSIAMRLWPERVIPKCVEDRSLAIAHGLESALWLEGDDGQWKPRKHLKTEISDLVRERTSPAAKASLQSLLDAPEGINSQKRRKSKAA